jgi:hypothetical protein
MCPQRAEAFALLLPYAHTNMMALHLKEISRAIPAGHHAVPVLVLVLGQAGLAHHAKAAAVFQCVAAAGRFTGGQSHGTGVAAAAGSQPGESMLRQSGAHRRSLLRGVESIHADPRRHAFTAHSPLGPPGNRLRE